MNHEHLEKLISTEFRIVGLEAKDPEAVTQSFRSWSRWSSAAVYVWEKSTGLARMEASHITIPRTKSETEILKHILLQKHFGIYILKGFNQFLQDPAIQNLLSQVSSDKRQNKTVILLDGKLNIPHMLYRNVLLASSTEIYTRIGAETQAMANIA